MITLTQSYYPTLPYESLYSHASVNKKLKEKKKKRNINIDLAILPSHDSSGYILCFVPDTLLVPKLDTQDILYYMIPEAIEIETSAMMFFFFSFICALDTILKD